jgi:hypothetical protein
MKTQTQFKQKAKVGVAGSLHNQLMANNATIPVVGKGAVELHYTDRSCYEVIEVSKDFKTVKLELLDARIDPEYLAAQKGRDCTGHQNWILEPAGHFITVVWRRGKWRTARKIVTFTKAWADSHPSVMALATTLTEEQHKAVYGNDIRPQHIVEGITCEKVEYDPIKLIFGRKDYYYDWSF